MLDPNPPANPQSLTFATLNIAPGETKYAKFVARASAECIGAVENVATVTGVYSSACLPAPGTATVGPVEARATVVCQSKPCISDVSARCRRRSASARATRWRAPRRTAATGRPTSP